MNDTTGWRQRMRQLCLTLAACGVLGGCTTWVKPGADDAARERAETHCKAVAHAQLPANPYTSVSLGASYSERKKCEKNSFDGCVKRDGRYYSVSKTKEDANSAGRESIFRDCMFQNGWSEAASNTMP